MVFNQNQAFWWDAARIVEDDFTYPLHEEAPHPQKQNRGRRSKTISKDAHGYYIRACPAGDDRSDPALDATIRTAAIHQKARREAEPDGPALRICPQDLMKKVRVQSVSNLIVFLVDLSWSMAVTQRMNATRTAILSILTDAYQSRDRVCLITFRKDSAQVVIPPTHSVMLAERSMKDVPIGGKTPLAAGLVKAHEVLSREKRVNQETNMLLIVLTDGDGNVSLNGGDPKEEAKLAAQRIAADGFRSIVINTEQITFDQGFANELAHQLNAPCHLVAGIQAEMLVKAVKSAQK